MFLRRLGHRLLVSSLMVAVTGVAGWGQQTPVPAQLPTVAAKLTTRGNKAVRVNGHKLNREGYIWPRDVVETVGCTRTVVQIGKPLPVAARDAARETAKATKDESEKANINADNILGIDNYVGRIVFAPDTKARVMYTETGIEVELMTGCVVVKPTLGMTASVKTPDGKIEQAATDKVSFVDVCYPENRVEEMATTYCCPPGAAWTRFIPLMALAGLVTAVTGGVTSGGIISPPPPPIRPPDPSASTPS